MSRGITLLKRCGPIVLQEKSATSSHSIEAETEADRLRAALHAAREVAYEWDLASDRVDWFGDAAALFCLKPDEVPQTVAAFDALVDAHFVQEFYNTFKGTTKEQAFESQFPVEGADHRVRWFEARA